MARRTILVTGGGSGIGRGLAEAFHRRGNQVIVTGRRQGALDEVTRANPGMRSMAMDVADPDAIDDLARWVADAAPDLDVLINNAGIQRPERLGHRTGPLVDADAMVAINLLGPMRLTEALLPILRRNADPTVVNVTSSLAFVPLAGVATYCATEAAMHSYTVSLRHASRREVEVIEVIPPYVQTSLGASHGSDPRAMPLGEFVAETMAILERGPPGGEVVVARAEALRHAVERGDFEATFRNLNEVMGGDPDRD